MMNYYSKRNKSLTKEINVDFFIAFNAYIEELIDENFNDNILINSFGEVDFNGYTYVSQDKINSKMAQSLGFKIFPFHKKTNVYITMQKTDTILDLIEFFYKHISDNGKNQNVRYDYTIKINEFFDNFNLLYKLKNGQIISKHSELMDNLIINDRIIINNDSKTQELINTAIEKFYNRSFNEQKIGLEKIVDAYQRISSWEDKDKKKSINKILEKVTKGDIKIIEFFEKELGNIWEIANNYMIRHTEIDKIDIEDSNLLEFLFYHYYIAIRFILKKYNH